VPTYTVTFPALPAVTAHGRDAVDALTRAIVESGSLLDIVEVCFAAAPEIEEACRHLSGDMSVSRTVVAWWMEQHPEIQVVEANPWTVAKADPTRWHEISAAKVEELNNVLPPIDFSGGFAVSEAIRHDGAAAVYLCVVNVGGKWWAKESTIAAARDALRLRAVAPDGPVEFGWSGS